MSPMEHEGFILEKNHPRVVAMARAVSPLAWTSAQPEAFATARLFWKDKAASLRKWKQYSKGTQAVGGEKTDVIFLVRVPFLKSEKHTCAHTHTCAHARTRS